MESLEYEPAWAFGANCDVSDPAAIAALIDRCNNLGIDAIESGNACSVAMEATQRGLLAGRGLMWGDDEKMMKLLDDIAYRNGIGADLAESPARAAAKWGAPRDFHVGQRHVHTCLRPAWIKGMGLSYATSNRGACHLRSYTPAAEVIGNVLGPSTVTDPLEWKGKGELTMIFQNVHTVTDCLDVCKFATFAESMASFAEQYSVITGNPMDADGLLKVGERVYNLERYYNNLAGFREGSDSLPDRFLKEPSDGPGSKGHVCELEPDAGGVLCQTGLGERRGTREQADRAGDPLIPGGNPSLKEKRRAEWLAVSLLRYLLPPEEIRPANPPQQGAC